MSWDRLTPHDTSVLANGAATTTHDLQNAVPESGLEIIDIQEKLYRHLLPEIMHCIDHQAELEVAMQKFSLKIQGLHSLKQLLETYLDRVLDHLTLSVDELIDALTLIDTVVSEHLQHLTALALVFAGDDDDLVVATNLLHAATPYSTSGASETIFMNFSVRSSRVTGPKMRVPIGSCLLFSRTAALPSKRMMEPSGRRTP